MLASEKTLKIAMVRGGQEIETAGGKESERETARNRFTNPQPACKNMNSVDVWNQLCYYVPVRI
jgi:hypothetical protein